MNLDATAQAALVRSGEISAEELVEAAIARIEKLNPEVNAVVIPLFEKARAAVATALEGPFRGVPYLLKDLSLVSKGDPSCQGIAGAKASGYRADHDSHFVERMRDAGFVLIGKTNLDELGMGTATAPAAWGPTRNPWDLTRSPSGSSGGSAAAVAARFVAVADASDAVGSIRMPASHCGVVGLKGSRGRVSVGPDVFADTLCGIASEMCIGRSIRDVAAILDIVSGHRSGDAYCAPPPDRPFLAEVGADPGHLRVGMLDADPTGRSPVDAECKTAARHIGAALSDLGHEVTEAHPTALEQCLPGPFGAAMSVIATRGLELWEQRLRRPLTEEDVEPATWGAAQARTAISGRDYAAGVDSLRIQGREIERWWEEDGWDLLLTPTMPSPPHPLGSPPNAEPMTFTVPFNVSGQPALSLPLHETEEGLPVGVQLVAGYGREDVLLRVAAQLETAVPWDGRRPALDQRRRAGETSPAPDGA